VAIIVGEGTSSGVSARDLADIIDPNPGIPGNRIAKPTPT